MKTDELIRAFLDTRDKKEALEKSHKEQLAPYRDTLNKIGALLQSRLLADGLQNLSVKGVGVAFLSETASAKVEEWELTLDWIKQHNAWDLLEARVNKSAFVDYHAQGHNVPGVSLTKELAIRVNRK